MESKGMDATTQIRRFHFAKAARRATIRNFSTALCALVVICALAGSTRAQKASVQAGSAGDKTTGSISKFGAKSGQAGNPTADAAGGGGAPPSSAGVVYPYD